jgi:hypothetical protein
MMKYPSCLYPEAICLKFCFKRQPSLSFRGDDIIQVQHSPLDQTTAPSEIQINEHEERPFLVFFSKKKHDFGLEKSIPRTQLKLLRSRRARAETSRPLPIPIDPVRTEAELKIRFLGLSAFFRGGNRQSQIRKKNTGVVRFHELRIFTWALIGLDCHHSPIHGTKKNI